MCSRNNKPIQQCKRIQLCLACLAHSHSLKTQFKCVMGHAVCFWCPDVLKVAWAMKRINWGQKEFFWVFFQQVSSILDSSIFEDHSWRLLNRCRFQCWNSWVLDLILIHCVTFHFKDYCHQPLTNCFVVSFYNYCWLW